MSDNSARLPSSAAVPALHAEGLRCGYRGRVVLDTVSLRVEPGETVRIVGRNGSGKSTVLRTFAGRQDALSGIVRVNGFPVGANGVEAKRHLGYAEDESLAFPFLTCREHLRMIARLHGLGFEAADRLLSELAETALGQHSDVLVRQCSRGTTRQLDLAAATLHRPSLLILDEAFDGLDREVLALWALRIRELVYTGTTLVYSNHSDDLTNTTLVPDRSLDVEHLTPQFEGVI